MQNPTIATTHFYRRASQRGLRVDVMEFILAFGSQETGAGAKFLTVLRRSLPVSLRKTRLARRAEGWILVRNADGRLSTCYRRDNAFRFIRRTKDGRVGRRVQAGSDKWAA